MLSWVKHFLCAATSATHFDDVIRHIRKNHVFCLIRFVYVYFLNSLQIKTKTNIQQLSFAPLIHTHTHTYAHDLLNVECRMLMLTHKRTRSSGHFYFLFGSIEKQSKAKKKIPNNYYVYYLILSSLFLERSNIRMLYEFYMNIWYLFSAPLLIFFFSAAPKK